MNVCGVWGSRVQEGRGALYVSSYQGGGRGPLDSVCVRVCVCACVFVHSRLHSVIASIDQVGRRSFCWKFTDYLAMDREEGREERERRIHKWKKKPWN